MSLKYLFASSTLRRKTLSVVTFPPTFPYYGSYSFVGAICERSELAKFLRHAPFRRERVEEAEGVKCRKRNLAGKSERESWEQYRAENGGATTPNEPILKKSNGLSKKQAAPFF